MQGIIAAVCGLSGGFPKSISSRTIFGDGEHDYGSSSRYELLRRKHGAIPPLRTAPSTFCPLAESDMLVVCSRVAVVVLAAQSGVAGCLALRLPLWSGC